MNLLARLLDLHTPGVVKERILDELFAATAAGFGREAPATAGLADDERLAAYARFTRNEAERAIGDGSDLAAIEASLRREAFALGRRLRGLLGVEGTADALAVARPLYRAIGIDFRGTPAICRLISALDEGVLAGMAGSGRLVFSQRLTEGHECCRARFASEEPPP